MAYSEVWDLDVFFEGGSDSPQLRAHLDETKVKVDQFAGKLQTFETPTNQSAAGSVAQLLEEGSTIQMHISQASGFISCLEAQDMNDTQANTLRSEVTQIVATFSSAFNSLEQKLAKTEQTVWEQLIQDEQLSDFRFVLEEWRAKAKEQLSEKEESLISALSVDGYHAWGQMYNTIVGSNDRSCNSRWGGKRTFCRTSEQSLIT